MNATPSDGLDYALPAGVRSRFVDDVNGLRMHVLESGHDGAPDRPIVLLLHGFPELAWSWRKVMPGLASAGFHVIAPDQRGYGRTTGWDRAYDGDLASFRPLNLVQDMLALVFAMGHRRVASVIGHDFGSPIAAHCALVRPDVFSSLVMMSAPFAGATAIGAQPGARADVQSDLARLAPPRKHYQWYYSTREAERDMLEAPQGLRDFLRAYYHVKSADWRGNSPRPLGGWSAEDLAALPAYYVMPLDQGMAQTVAPYMPSAAEIASCAWLTEPELDVYCAEFARTGFQGGLQWYRCGVSGIAGADLRLFAGRTIDVPATFIAGAADWGVYQSPGLFERLDRVCSDLGGRHLVAGAGHWVQQEQPSTVTDLLLAFLSR
ncbi:MAG: alpha/beta fold hydrolase [Caulobacterales bacterium]